MAGSDAAAERIAVVVRARPLNSREERLSAASAWRWEEGRTIVLDEAAAAAADEASAARTLAPARFTFDALYTPGSTTAQLYAESCQTMVHQAVRGYHASLFAYGQTSTGKTHTMHGPLPAGDTPRRARADARGAAGAAGVGGPPSPAEDVGVIPQAVADVFASVEAEASRTFLVRLSYLEIYNESVNDLLNATATNLRVYEHPATGVTVGGLTEEVVIAAPDVSRLLALGDAHRHIGRTNFNEVSSRSHTIVRLVIESQPRAAPADEAAVAAARGALALGPPPSPAPASSVSPSSLGGRRGGRTIMSTLNLIDLAGSENARASGAMGVRKREGGYINKSLLTLGTVVSKLASYWGRHGGAHGATTHVPYRDSKLTRILQPSLSGNAHVLIVCTISPSITCVDESLNTLKFAARAKKIRQSAHVNEVVDDAALLQAYKNEVEILRAQLARYQSLEEARRVSSRALLQARGTGSTAGSDGASAGPGTGGAHGVPALASPPHASPGAAEGVDGGDGDELDDTDVDVVREALHHINRLILNSGELATPSAAARDVVELHDAPRPRNAPPQSPPLRSDANSVAAVSPASTASSPAGGAAGGTAEAIPAVLKRHVTPGTPSAPWALGGAGGGGGVGMSTSQRSASVSPHARAARLGSSGGSGGGSGGAHGSGGGARDIGQLAAEVAIEELRHRSPPPHGARDGGSRSGDDSSSDDDDMSLSDDDVAEEDRELALARAAAAAAAPSPERPDSDSTDPHERGTPGGTGGGSDSPGGVGGVGGGVGDGVDVHGELIRIREQLRRMLARKSTRKPPQPPSPARTDGASPHAVASPAGANEAGPTPTSGAAAGDDGDSAVVHALRQHVAELQSELAQVTLKLNVQVADSRHLQTQLSEKEADLADVENVIDAVEEHQARIEREMAKLRDDNARLRRRARKAEKAFSILAKRAGIGVTPPRPTQPRPPARAEGEAGGVAEETY